MQVAAPKACGAIQLVMLSFNNVQNQPSAWTFCQMAKLAIVPYLTQTDLNCLLYRMICYTLCS